MIENVQLAKINTSKSSLAKGASLDDHQQFFGHYFGVTFITLSRPVLASLLLPDQRTGPCVGGLSLPISPEDALAIHTSIISAFPAFVI